MVELTRGRPRSRKCAVVQTDTIPNESALFMSRVAKPREEEAKGARNRESIRAESNTVDGMLHVQLREMNFIYSLSIVILASGSGEPTTPFSIRSDAFQ